MIISHTHRFIFIHCPKTAGTAISNALATCCEPSELVVATRKNGLKKHESAERIRDFLGAEKWKHYFRFTFERNPWDRVVSLYKMQFDPDNWNRADVGFATRIRNSLLERKYRVSPPSFRDWFYRRAGSRWRNHFPKYLGNLYHLQGDLAVDFVGRFENLQTDFHKILGWVGLHAHLDSPSQVPRKRFDLGLEHSEPSYRRFYDDNMRLIVEEQYAAEIDAFEYTF